MLTNESCFEIYLQLLGQAGWVVPGLDRRMVSLPVQVEGEHTLFQIVEVLFCGSSFSFSADLVQRKLFPFHTLSDSLLDSRRVCKWVRIHFPLFLRARMV